ncbi:MAG: DUF3526 domain-containing protein [Myxococcota bacterium]
MSAFDPGILDFAGSAVWMEAHSQAPPTLRRAEYLAPLLPFEWVSPAWAVQFLGSLLLATMLFGSIAGEREQGTLAMVVSSGVSPRTIGRTKVAAGIIASSAFALMCLAASLLVTAIALRSSIPWARVFSLGVAYLAGFAVLAGLFLWLSVRSRSAGVAFAWCGGLWVVFAVVVPFAGAELGARLYPTPIASAFDAEAKLRAGDAFWRDEDNKKRVTDEFALSLAKNEGHDSVDGLGFNREGLELQASEVFANQVFDELYGALYATHRRQGDVLAALSFLSPVLALRRISAALSGTDTESQIDFATQAEQHRRVIIEQMNIDMIRHAGDEGYGYTADVELWESIADFEPALQGLGKTFARLWVEWTALAVWLLTIFVLLSRALTRLEVYP